MISKFLSSKSLTFTRLSLWYIALIVCSLTRILFLYQTWSNLFIFIMLINFIFLITNLFLSKYSKYYLFLVISIVLITFSSLIVYILYAYKIYYSIMNLLTINIMTNDRNQNLLAQTLIHYKCCRIQEEILFDSENERDYFLLFPFCQQVIIENETNRDNWDHITTCGSLFKRIIFFVRLFLLIDFLLLFIHMIQYLIFISNFHEQISNENDSSLVTYQRNNKKK